MISEHQLRTVIYYEWRQEHSVSRRAATPNINNTFGKGTVSRWTPNRKKILEDLVTGDESWILYDNSARHAVWLPRDAETPTQPKPDQHSRKHLLSV
ncbi:hypothetical protein OESDEN_19285 [Oesophagostomum dentatum]|uniref:Mos1 transposase HTH domain-containing protein n=1 Tax=Oesophagostomum dentatum TaxID=61180 RepID=A0A0B1S6R0_OESDE|nr:hypothetical protein OESDEN_19285 [Oesophagostomum dentatum]